MNVAHWMEYDAAAAWCARRGIEGKIGDRLPLLLDGNVVAEITANTEEFCERVKLHAYAQAQDRAEILNQPGYCA